MRKDKHDEVSGIRAPGPKMTPWAALLVAVALGALFLVGMGLWRVAVAVFT